MRNLSMYLAATAVIASTAQALGAQVIEGQIADGETFEVLEDVSITLVHPDGHDLAEPVASSASGRFSVSVPGPGSYFLRFERLGYTTIVEGVFDFESNEGRLAVEVYLRKQPVAIEGIEVAVEQTRVRRSLRAAGFYERVTSGFGDFITPEAIEERGLVPNVSDYLRGIPGVSTYGSLIVFRSQGSGGLVRKKEDGSIESLGFCEPYVWVDGIRMTQASKPGRMPPPYGNVQVLEDTGVDMGADAALSAMDVAAIEVYRSAASTPLRWGGVDSACGTLVIWTKQGG